MANRLLRILQRAPTIFQDLKNIPNTIAYRFHQNDKRYVNYHLKYVCEGCPEHRQQTRDVDGNGECWWREHWQKGNTSIPHNFGFINFIRYYLGSETLNLDKFKTLEENK